MEAYAQVKTMDQISFLPMKTITRRIGLSRATIYRMIAKGTFPRPYALSEGRVGWNSQEIEEWIAMRLTRSEIPRAR